jgi:hypothetical protein
MSRAPAHIGVEAQLRCYLMRKGHIASVEFLAAGPDSSLIEQGERIFVAAKARMNFDGFEIWDGARRVYTFPEEEAPVPQPGSS